MLFSDSKELVKTTKLQRKTHQQKPPRSSHNKQPQVDFNWRLVFIQFTLSLKVGFQHQSEMWPYTSHPQATTGQIRPQVSLHRARATPLQCQPLTWWIGRQVGSQGRRLFFTCNFPLRVLTELEKSNLKRREEFLKYKWKTIAVEYPPRDVAILFE